MKRTTHPLGALVTSKFRGANAVKFLAARLLPSFFLVTAGVAVAQSQNDPPARAYPVNPPNFQRAPDDGSIRRVPGSTAGFTLTQVRDLFATPDWHPEDHPRMPSIVATGRKPDVMACGVCQPVWSSRSLHRAADHGLQKRTAQRFSASRCQ